MVPRNSAVIRTRQSGAGNGRENMTRRGGVVLQSPPRPERPMSRPRWSALDIYIYVTRRKLKTRNSTSISALRAAGATYDMAPTSTSTMSCPPTPSPPSRSPAAPLAPTPASPLPAPPPRPLPAPRSELEPFSSSTSKTRSLSFASLSSSAHLDQHRKNTFGLQTASTKSWSGRGRGTGVCFSLHTGSIKAGLFTGKGEKSRGSGRGGVRPDRTRDIVKTL